MKTQLLLFFLLSVMTINAQTTSIPDINFEQALIDLGYDTNGLNGNILNSDAELVTSLYVNDKAIGSMQGISAFVNLTDLRFSDNNVNTIDLSNHPALEILVSQNNPLTALDLSQNFNLTLLFSDNTAIESIAFSIPSAITSLNIANSQTTSIDLSNMPNLDSLDITGSNISNVDVSNNPLLAGLYLADTGSNNIDVSMNPNLQALSNVGNNITTVDLSNNPLLSAFYAFSSSITTLDLSANTMLTLIQVNDTNLNSLNVANGNNGILTTFIANNNPNLTCIQVDDVEQAYLKKFNQAWTKDGTTLYETNCNAASSLTVNVPDGNFEAALIEFGIDRSGVMDNTITLSEALNTGFMDLQGRNIGDATGLESFRYLTGLNMANNGLNSIDITNYEELVYLDVYTNNLNTLNLNNNLKLELLYCGQNNLTGLNAGPLNLTVLSVDENNIVALDLANSTDLTSLFAYNNNLSVLDVSNSPNLSVLSLAINNLSSLNIANGNNADIMEFYADQNPNLFCIQVDAVEQAYEKKANELWFKDNQALYEIDCNNPSANTVYVQDDNLEQALIDFGIDRSGVLDGAITLSEALNTTFLDLNSRGISDPTGLEAFKYLTGLNISTNNLSTININTMTNLDYIDVYNNDLNSLNVSNNPNLQRIFCAENNLTGINVGNLNLIEFSMDNNNIVSVDLSSSTDLLRFYAYNNNLNAIDFSNNPNLEIASLSENQNIGSLDLSAQTQLVVLYAGHTGISTIDISGNPNLEFLELYSNGFTTIDVSNNLNLIILDLNNNDVSGLVDLSNHTALETVLFEGNNLEELDLKNGNTNAITNFDTRNNPNLFCVQVDDENFAYANFLQRDSFTAFSTDCNFTQSIDAISSTDNLILYPNPVQSEFQISTTDRIEGVNISTMTGKIIKDIKGNISNIDISDLAQGIYLVKIQTDTASVTKKIIKN